MLRISNIVNGPLSNYDGAAADRTTERERRASKMEAPHVSPPKEGSRREWRMMR